MKEYMSDKYIWYTVSVTYGGEKFPRMAIADQDIGAASAMFDDVCAKLLENEEPLVERVAEVNLYEQHTGIGSQLPMRKLEIQQDGKYRIGYLATPDQLRVTMYLRNKLASIGVNDNYISARISD